MTVLGHVLIRTSLKVHKIIRAKIYAVACCKTKMEILFLRDQLSWSGGGGRVCVRRKQSFFREVLKNAAVSLKIEERSKTKRGKMVR